MVSHVFPLAALFSNTVNTMERNGSTVTETEGGLPVFDTDILRPGAHERLCARDAVATC